MANNSNQKLKILYLMKIFFEDTDHQHGITMKDILDKLDSYGIQAERKSVMEDIKTLKAFGYDIILNKKNYEYYLKTRTFSYPELALLVDAIQSSKFLTERKSKILIKQLEGLTSIHIAKLLENQVYVEGRIKVQNESIYHNVNAIQRALREKRKIRFKYNNYDVSKKLIPRKEGAVYIANPVGLTYVNEFYYLTEYSSHYNDFVNYRVDRMTELDITDTKTDRIPQSIQFDLSEYSKRKFSMFGGDFIRAQLVFDNDIMNSIIDKFGKDVKVEPVDDSTARIYIGIENSPPFFGWITQFGNKIKITSPDSLAKEYVEFLKWIQTNYK